MEYLVVIDSRSPAGKAFAAKWKKIQMGDEQHVGLTCTEMDASNPAYMFLRTVPIPPATSGQTLHLPHGNVLMVLEYDKGERQPPGFV